MELPQVPEEVLVQRVYDVLNQAFTIAPLQKYLSYLDDAR